jgi:hypothetical protein
MRSLLKRKNGVNPQSADADRESTNPDASNFDFGNVVAALSRFSVEEVEDARRASRDRASSSRVKNSGTRTGIAH